MASTGAGNGVAAAGEGGVVALTSSSRPPASWDSSLRAPGVAPLLTSTSMGVGWRIIMCPVRRWASCEAGQSKAHWGLVPHPQMGPGAHL